MSRYFCHCEKGVNTLLTERASVCITAPDPIYLAIISAAKEVAGSLSVITVWILIPPSQGCVFVLQHPPGKKKLLSTLYRITSID